MMEEAVMKHSRPPADDGVGPWPLKWPWQTTTYGATVAGKWIEPWYLKWPRVFDNGGTSFGHQQMTESWPWTRPWRSPIDDGANVFVEAMTISNGWRGGGCH